MDEEEFTTWMGSSLGAMHGLAVSISIIGHTAQLRSSTITHHRIVGANARDAVSIIDSLARDPYRRGGVYGLAGFTIAQIHKRSGCWLDRTFSPVLADLKLVRAKRPAAILNAVELMRREATAHFPIAGKADRNPTSINADDMWQAYSWLKEMLLVWLSRLNPPYQWHYQEHEVIETVLRDLSAPILPGR